MAILILYGVGGSEMSILNFSDNIIHLRRKKGITQEVLATLWV